MRREARGSRATRSQPPSDRADATTDNVQPPTRIADLPAWDRELLELMIARPGVRRRESPTRSTRARFHVARRPTNLRRLLPPGATKGTRRRFRPPAGRIRRARNEEPAGRSSTNRARPKAHGRPRTLACRPAGNAPPPPTTNTIAAPTSPPPAKAPATPNNCSPNSANNPNQNISAITKGERSKLHSALVR